MNKLKKYVWTIGLACFLIIFVVLLVLDKNGDENLPSISSSPTIDVDNFVVATPLKGQLSAMEYEDIIRTFYDSKNFAIKTQEKSFLKGYLKEGSEFEKKILEDVKKGIKSEFDILEFKGVEKIEKGIHIIKMRIYKDNKEREAIFKIKDMKDKYCIIYEK